ncbi:unnamed protein product [Ectocarpus fasciculatus]
MVVRVGVRVVALSIGGFPYLFRTAVSFICMVRRVLHVFLSVCIVLVMHDFVTVFSTSFKGDILGEETGQDEVASSSTRFDQARAIPSYYVAFIVVWMISNRLCSLGVHTPALKSSDQLFLGKMVAGESEC